MFGMQAYLVAGKMFAAVGDQGVLVKLPAEQRQPILQAGRGEMVGEWLTLPVSTLEEDPERVLALVRQSFEYVQAAPPPAKPPREERRFRKRQY